MRERERERERERNNWLWNQEEMLGVYIKTRNKIRIISSSATGLLCTKVEFGKGVADPAPYLIYDD
jgi:hypothetical protein